MVEQLLSDGRGRRLCRPAGLNRELLLVRVGAISDRPHLNRAHVLFGRTLCAPTTHEQSSLLPPVSCLLVKKIFFKKRIIEINDEISFEKKIKDNCIRKWKMRKNGSISLPKEQVSNDTTLLMKLSGQRTVFGCNSGKSNGHRRSKPLWWISQV